MDKNMKKNEDIEMDGQRKLDEYFGMDEETETDGYLEMELETEWLPREGESQEECGIRIRKRLLEKYGKIELKRIREERKKMFPDFEEFLRNNSK